jgi:hypothetical protein
VSTSKSLLAWSFERRNSRGKGRDPAKPEIKEEKKVGLKNSNRRREERKTRKREPELPGRSDECGQAKKVQQS